MRQQRANSARGQVQLPNRRVQPDIAWVPNTIVDADVWFDLDTPIAELQLIALPRMHESSGDQYPIASVIDGAQLKLTYADPPALPTTFEIETQDPGIRTRFGGFFGKASQRIVTSPAPLGPVLSIAWTLSPATLTDISIFFAVGTGTRILTCMDVIREQGTDQHPTTIAVHANDVALTFASPLTPGDFIQVTALDLSTAQPDLDLRQLTPQSVVIT